MLDSLVPPAFRAQLCLLIEPGAFEGFCGLCEPGGLLRGAAVARAWVKDLLLHLGPLAADLGLLARRQRRRLRHERAHDCREHLCADLLDHLHEDFLHVLCERKRGGRRRERERADTSTENATRKRARGGEDGASGIGERDYI